MGTCLSYTITITLLGFVVGLILILVGFLAPTECQSSRCIGASRAAYKKEREKEIAATLLHCKIAGFVFLGLSGLLLPFFLAAYCAKKNSAAKEEVPLNQQTTNDNEATPEFPAVEDLLVISGMNLV